MISWTFRLRKLGLKLWCYWSSCQFRASELARITDQPSSTLTATRRSRRKNPRSRSRWGWTRELSQKSCHAPAQAHFTWRRASITSTTCRGTTSGSYRPSVSAAASSLQIPTSPASSMGMFKSRTYYYTLIMCFQVQHHDKINMLSFVMMIDERVMISFSCEHISVALQDTWRWSRDSSRGTEELHRKVSSDPRHQGGCRGDHPQFQHEVAFDRRIVARCG